MWRKKKYNKFFYFYYLKYDREKKKKFFLLHSFQYLGYDPHKILPHCDQCENGYFFNSTNNACIFCN